ncbi:MAG: hypothetical protein ACXWTH_04735, partial [Methylosarcina sp.]
SGSSSTKSCEKPKFSEFAPADKSQVAANSEFSFKASATTNPERVKVTIKGQSVAVTVTPLKLGYLVKGRLPESLKNGFARINIEAESQNKCKGGGGWLLNISE